MKAHFFFHSTMGQRRHSVPESKLCGYFKWITKDKCTATEVMSENGEVVKSSEFRMKKETWYFTTSLSSKEQRKPGIPAGLWLIKRDSLGKIQKLINEMRMAHWIMVEIIQSNVIFRSSVHYIIRIHFCFVIIHVEYSNTVCLVIWYCDARGLRHLSISMYI